MALGDQSEHRSWETKANVEIELLGIGGGMGDQSHHGEIVDYYY